MSPSFLAAQRTYNLVSFYNSMSGFVIGSKQASEVLLIKIVKEIMWQKTEL